MIEWWMILGVLGYTAAILDAGYEWGRRRGKKQGKEYQLAHPRPEDAVWVPSTRPKPVARSRAQVTRAAYVERESGEEVQPTRVKKARMRRRRRTF